MEKYVRAIRTMASSFALCVLITPTVYAKQYTVEQNNKTFLYNGSVTAHMSLNRGDEILFKNNDSVFHNIYSLSKIKTFNIGSYGNGESASILFDKAGTVKVKCAIHPRMMINVEVLE
jgi:plastocyanin